MYNFFLSVYKCVIISIKACPDRTVTEGMSRRSREPVHTFWIFLEPGQPSAMTWTSLAWILLASPSSVNSVLPPLGCSWCEPTACVTSSDKHNVRQSTLMAKLENTNTCACHSLFRSPRHDWTRKNTYQVRNVVKLYLFILFLRATTYSVMKVDVE